MSDTDKDVPYWVRLNHEGTLTDHDHLRFGKPIIKRRWLRDEDNNLIYETLPLYRRAESILGLTPIWRNGYSDGYWNNEHNEKKNSDGSYPEPIIRQAHILVDAGREREYIEVGTWTRATYVDEVIGHVKDYCTAGEKLPDNSWGYYRNGELPCTPALSGDKGWWHYGDTGTRRAEHERYYGQDRVRTRDHFRKLANAWNCGDALDDWDENEVLTDDTWGYILW